MVSATALDAQRLVDEIAWFAPQLRVCLLPDWETLPYDQFSPHQDLVSERLATLYRIPRGEFDVAGGAGADRARTGCARPPTSRAHVLPDAGRDGSTSTRCARSSPLAGYQHVTQVVAPGEFCVRGGLIDLFPMGSALPYRSTSFDDEIETHQDLRRRHAAHALSGATTCACCRRASSRSTTPGRTRFRSRWREMFEGDPSKKRAVQGRLATASPPAGIEYYLPLFFESTATLFDYLPRGCDASRCTATSRRRSTTSGSDTESRYRLLRGDKDRPLLPPRAAVRARRRVLRAR